MSENAELWQAVNELRERQNSHDVVHEGFRGRIEAVSSGLAELKGSVDLSRRERTAQYEDISAKLDEISREISEERGARKFRAKLISRAIAIASAVGLGAWIHGGGE